MKWLEFTENIHVLCATWYFDNLCTKLGWKEVDTAMVLPAEPLILKTHQPNQGFSPLLYEGWCFSFSFHTNIFWEQQLFLFMSKLQYRRIRVENIKGVVSSAGKVISW